MISFDTFLNLIKKTKFYAKINMRFISIFIPDSIFIKIFEKLKKNIIIYEFHFFQKKYETNSYISAINAIFINIKQ